jgi:hypothetical protein
LSRCDELPVAHQALQVTVRRLPGNAELGREATCDTACAIAGKLKRSVPDNRFVNHGAVICKPPSPAL